MGWDERFLDLRETQPNAAWADFLDHYAELVFAVVRFHERDPDAASDCFLYVCEQLHRNGMKKLGRFERGGAASLSTWLRAVVRNLCVDWYRRKHGHFRLFRSIEALSPLDQQVYRCVYERGMGAEQAFLRLRPQFPHLSPRQISDSVERVEERLSSHQRARLSSRGTYETELLREVVDDGADPEAHLLAKEREEALRAALAALDPSDRLLLRLRFDQELTLSEIGNVLALGSPQAVDRKLRKILEGLRRTLR